MSPCGLGTIAWFSPNVSTGVLASRERGISTSTGRSGGKPMLMLYELAEMDQVDVAEKMPFVLHLVAIGPFFIFP